jgi:hypothetical protein
MKSKLSLRNLAKAGLLFNLVFFLLFFPGCTSSTTPTFSTEDIPKAIQDICRNEYKIDILATLVGETLWIYLPVEDIFVPSDKPEKYVEKFRIEENTGESMGGLLKFDYKISPIPDEEKFNEVKYNKSVQQKINNVWKVLRRVIFSLDSTKKNEPKFFCIVTADIKNGFEMQELFYHLDLKKVSYGYISWEEYYHRSINETGVSDKIIGDILGRHVDYKNFTLEEFILEQIKNRVRLKFDKPEVDKEADIDKEITKVIINTIKIYGFKDFEVIELYNSLTKNRTILNKAAVLATPIE